MSIEKLTVHFKTLRLCARGNEQKQILITDARVTFRGTCSPLRGTFSGLNQLRTSALMQSFDLYERADTEPLLEFSLRTYADDILVETAHLGLQLHSLQPSGTTTLYEIKGSVRTKVAQEASLYALRAKYHAAQQARAAKKYANKTVRHSYTKCNKLTLSVYKVDSNDERYEDVGPDEDDEFDLFD